MKKLTLILFLNSIVITVHSQDSLVITSDCNQEIAKLRNEVMEIRRDQLNYKIEKDLLKETYSANHSTVQLVLSLILGVFAIFGYLGVRGIVTLRKEYDLELNKIKDLKSDFEQKLKELLDSQTKVQKQIVSIDNLNEEQSLKIRLLEIKEKVSNYFSRNAFQRAIEYAVIGLEISKDDVELLRFRAHALLKIKNYSESIEAHKKLMHVDPSDLITVTNLAEIYLLVSQIDNYEKLVLEKSASFTKKNNQLLTYFEALKIYQSRREDLQSFIKSFMKNQDLTTFKNQLDTWDLGELFSFMSDQPDSFEKTLLLNFASYLKGTISGNQILELVKDI